MTLTGFGKNERGGTRPLPAQFGKLAIAIRKRQACVAVVGLGYVGLPLALEFSKAGFPVIGFDTDMSRTRRLSRSESYVDDVSVRSLRSALKNGLRVTSSARTMRAADCYIICVPTPLDSHREPDLSAVVSASQMVAAQITRPSLVILESTTYPGTTDHIVRPILEAVGHAIDKNVALAYSPERVDPGSKLWRIRNTPKVVGGAGFSGGELAELLYSAIVEAGIVRVTDATTAESVKMVENIFRGVNIALVNELALIFERIGVDAWETVKAASTKPFAFLPHYPGPGVGGHCIPLDPSYLAYRAKKEGVIARFIGLSSEINDFMSIHSVNLAEQGLREHGLTFRGARVAVLGLTYKPNISDTRESPSLRIMAELLQRGGRVRVHDPFVRSVSVSGTRFPSVKSVNAALKGSDVALILVRHNSYLAHDFAASCGLMRRQILVDCCNTLGGRLIDGASVISLGRPYHGRKK